MSGVLDTEVIEKTLGDIERRLYDDKQKHKGDIIESSSISLLFQKILESDLDGMCYRYIETPSIFKDLDSIGKKNSNRSSEVVGEKKIDDMMLLIDSETSTLDILDIIKRESSLHLSPSNTLDVKEVKHSTSKDRKGDIFIKTDRKVHKIETKTYGLSDVFG